MPNNLLQPYAADQCAKLWKKYKNSPFPLTAIPSDVKKSSLKSNGIITRTEGGYKLTPRGIDIMRRRRLI